MASCFDRLGPITEVDEESVYIRQVYTYIQFNFGNHLFILHTIQNLHSLDALLPRWVSSSDARTLSHNMHKTGAITNTSLSEAASNILRPFSRLIKSLAMGVAISIADSLLEHEMKRII